MTAALPTGTVTFLFSDVEGSTKLLTELGTEAYAKALLEHRERVRSAFAAHGGVEVGTEGDSFFVAFPTAQGALAAAAEAQGALAGGRIRVRMGLHTGTPEVVADDYVGLDVHRAARIAAAGHGGQVLVSSSTAALTGTAGMRDLGEHRLKDLAAPERIWQLGESDFPPLKSLHQTNLPTAPTPFVGRERELAEVSSLLARDEVRVLTLTGPGGTGKTRLAMQAAAEAAERYPQGVWWVPLDALRGADRVLMAAAEVLGVSGDLAEHIADKRMLIVFDNFEQVIDDAPAVAALLSRTPKLEILATSREPLRISGEREFPVPPLARDDAVRLFHERAEELGKNVLADPAVSRICARLDDLPLAIELAAARIRVMSPAQIAERLEQRLPLLTTRSRDVPERQRTLRSAIAWSHELLSRDEQLLFARLSVFRGGWTLDAAENVADADVDLLQSLVEKSLVRHGDDRFSMLETIREYAVERLEASAEADALRTRHADHFFALAHEAEPHLMREEREWADRLEREKDNLRAALERLESSGEIQRALELGGAIFEFWCIKAHYKEGWRDLSRLLALDARPTLAAAKAMQGAAHLALSAGVDGARAVQLARDAVALHRAVGDAAGIAYAQFEYTRELWQTDDLAAAVAVGEMSMNALAAVGDEHHELQVIQLLASAAYETGDRARGIALYEEIRRRARATGDVDNLLASLEALGHYAATEGRRDEALALLAEAYPLAKQTAETVRIDLLLLRLARALALAGRTQEAAVLLGTVEAMHEASGWEYPGWVARIRDEAVEHVRAGLDEATTSAAKARGRSLTPDEAAALAFAPLRDGVGAP